MLFVFSNKAVEPAQLEQDRGSVLLTLFATGGGRQNPLPPHPTILLITVCLSFKIFYYQTFIFLGLHDIDNFFFFEIFRGNPPFGPPKNLKISWILKVTPHDLHNPILPSLAKDYQKKDICKKLELKILKFGRMADVFVKMKILRFLKRFVKN